MTVAAIPKKKKAVRTKKAPAPNPELTEEERVQVLDVFHTLGITWPVQVVSSVDTLPLTSPLFIDVLQIYFGVNITPAIEGAYDTLRKAHGKDSVVFYTEMVRGLFPKHAVPSRVADNISDLHTKGIFPLGRFEDNFLVLKK